MSSVPGSPSPTGREILTVLADGPLDVGEMLRRCCRTAEPELVVKAMWDLVEDGVISYGMDARVALTRTSSDG